MSVIHETLFERMSCVPVVKQGKCRNCLKKRCNKADGSSRTREEELERNGGVSRGVSLVDIPDRQSDTPDDERGENVSVSPRVLLSSSDEPDGKERNCGKEDQVPDAERRVVSEEFLVKRQ